MAIPATNKKADGPAPAYKVCRFDDIASFRPGIWNGEPHGAEFNSQIVANFKKYSQGATPYYRPYVSVNHKDEFAAGHVSGARVGADNILHLDAADVPEVVGQLRASGAITQPSIEYFKPVRDPATGELTDGFRGPDGKIVDSPVLKCLTLLGADAPAVKGLPPLPFARFNQSGPTAKFGALPMDRAAMIAALQALGADVAGLTDATPDAVVKAWLESLQAAKGNTPAPAELPPDNPAMADAGAAIGAATPAPAPALAPAIPGVAGSPQPSSVVLKFSDQTPKAVADALEPIRVQTEGWLRSLAAQSATAQQNLAAVNRAANQQAHAAKFADASAFVSKLATPDAQGFCRIQPAQKPLIMSHLMGCDNQAVRKFSDGKTSGTAFEEAKAMYVTTLPKLRAVGERVPDGTAGTVAAGSGGGLDPARRARMLGATDQGRAILAAEKKK